MSDISKLNSVLPVQLSVQDQSKDVAEAAAVVRAVQYLNRTEFSSERQESFLSHTYDPATQRMIIRVLDRRTKEVLYQLPPDQVLRMAADARRAHRSSAQE